jgi:hypothetical protein
MYGFLNSPTQDGWQGLIPLHSTKEDAEKILGAPKREGIAYFYETEKEKVTISYSRGQCAENKSSKWNVTKGTIISIMVVPKEPLFASTFVKDLQQFERGKVPHMEGAFYYRKKDNSISFETRVLPDNEERITDILYSPSEKESKLRCTCD